MYNRIQSIDRERESLHGILLLNMVVIVVGSLLCVPCFISICSSVHEVCGIINTVNPTWLVVLFCWAGLMGVYICGIYNNL